MNAITIVKYWKYAFFKHIQFIQRETNGAIGFDLRRLQTKKEWQTCEIVPHSMHSVALIPIGSVHGSIVVRPFAIVISSIRTLAVAFALLPHSVASLDFPLEFSNVQLIDIPYFRLYFLLPLLKFNDNKKSKRKSWSFITWVELECYNARCLFPSKHGENSEKEARASERERETMTNVDWLTLQMANNMLVAIAMCAPTAGDNIKFHAHSIQHAIWNSVCVFRCVSIFLHSIWCFVRSRCRRSIESSELQICTRFILRPPQNKLNTHEMNIHLNIFANTFDINAGNVDAKPKKNKEQKLVCVAFQSIFICIQWGLPVSQQFNIIKLKE